MTKTLDTLKPTPNPQPPTPNYYLYNFILYYFPLLCKVTGNR